MLAASIGEPEPYSQGLPSFTLGTNGDSRALPASDYRETRQSRVAKVKAGDPGVSLDLLVQGPLAAGATRREIAAALSPRKKAAFA